MLLPRWIFGAGDTGAASVIVLVALPVAFALFLSLRFRPRILGPDHTAIHGSALYAVATGWTYGARAVTTTPSVASTLSALAAHRGNKSQAARALDLTLRQLNYRVKVLGLGGDIAVLRHPL